MGEKEWKATYKEHYGEGNSQPAKLFVRFTGRCFSSFLLYRKKGRKRGKEGRGGEKREGKTRGREGREGGERRKKNTCCNFLCQSSALRKKQSRTQLLHFPSALTVSSIQSPGCCSSSSQESGSKGGQLVGTQGLLSPACHLPSPPLGRLSAGRMRFFRSGEKPWEGPGQDENNPSPAPGSHCMLTAPFLPGSRLCLVVNPIPDVS